eukprot:Sdes_comp9929_c0_seq1m1472
MMGIFVETMNHGFHHLIAIFEEIFLLSYQVISFPLLMQYFCLLTLCILARFVNIHSVFEMFFDDHFFLDKNLRILFQGEMDPSPFSSRSLSFWFRLTNWAVGIVFMSSFSHYAACFSPESSSAAPQFVAVTCVISLAYLLFLFFLPVCFHPSTTTKCDQSFASTPIQSHGKEVSHHSCAEASSHNLVSENKSTLSPAMLENGWKFLFTLAVVCPFLFHLTFRAPHFSDFISASFSHFTSSLPFSTAGPLASLLAVLLSGILYFHIFKTSSPLDPSMSSLDGKYFPKVNPSRRLKAFPPPFPNGWFKLAESCDVSTGAVRYIQALGADFAVFRGGNGKIAVLHAFCTHMGANLAGGKVKGSTLECPFHGWRFGEDGVCEEIPYSDKRIPECSKVKSYPVREFHRQILVWYDAEGRDPLYEPHIAPEIASENFVYRGKYTKFVDMHIQDFAENSADTAHFDFLHSTFPMPILRHFIKVKHVVEWARDEKNPHQASFTDLACLTFQGKPIAHTSAFAKITFDGPGGVVYFRFFTPIGRIVLIKTFLPLAPLKQKVQDVWFAESSMPRFLVKYIVGNFITAFADDIDVWENKTWASKILLVQGDGPMTKLRSWFAQFYSPHSVTFDAHQRLDW